MYQNEEWEDVTGCRRNQYLERDYLVDFAVEDLREGLLKGVNNV